MYCTKCGKNIPDDSKFCPECGTSCSGGSKDNTKNINISTPDIVDIFAVITSIILIYSGFNSRIESKNKLVYAFPIACMTSLVIGSLITLSSII